MCPNGYVLDASCLYTTMGEGAVRDLLMQADEYERLPVSDSEARDRILSNLEVAVPSWLVAKGNRTDDGQPLSAGKHLLAIVELSQAHRRTRPEQVKGVSDPRSLPHLLQDLLLGRAIVIIPSPIDPEQIAAWAILDLAPRRAMESHARVVDTLMDHWPHFYPTPGGPLQVAGHSWLRFAATTDGVEERPKPSFVAQILRLREIPGWNPPDGRPLGDWLRAALWDALEPYLIGQGIHLLVGEKLVSLDGKPVVRLGDPQPGEVKPGWSFYDHPRFMDLGVWSHEILSSTSGMIGALQAAFPLAAGERRTDLTYSVMVAPLDGVQLDLTPGRAASISRRAANPV